MDWLPMCLTDEAGGFTLSGRVCFWGLEAKDVVGILGLSVLGILGIVWVVFKRSAKAILQPKPGWPLYNNLSELPGNYVVRREQAMLEKRLDEGRGTVISAAIAGMGGVGKTTLAMGTAQAKRAFRRGLGGVIGHVRFADLIADRAGRGA